MWIRDEIADVALRLNIHAAELPASHAVELEGRAERVFARAGSGPLWERVIRCESFRHPMAWKRIDEFVREPSTLFVRDAQGLCAFRFDGPNGIVATIESCSGFVFYVVDDANSYMLSFNDHDVLIGCGAAADWVRELRSR